MTSFGVLKYRFQPPKHAARHARRAAGTDVPQSCWGIRSSSSKRRTVPRFATNFMVIKSTVDLGEKWWKGGFQSMKKLCGARIFLWEKKMIRGQTLDNKGCSCDAKKGVEDHIFMMTIARKWIGTWAVSQVIRAMSERYSFVDSWHLFLLRVAMTIYMYHATCIPCLCIMWWNGTAVGMYLVAVSSTA